VAPGDFAGRPAVFLFWDSDCAPCLNELAHSTSLHQAFPQAAFVAVSLSGRDATRRALARIRLGADVTRAMGPDKPGGLLAALGDPEGGLPFTAVFAGEGWPCLHSIGPLTSALLAEAARQCALRSSARP
jgi:thiol-disulfide isomerase/thioredoxin